MKKIIVEVAKNSQRYYTLMKLLREDNYIFSIETEKDNKPICQNDIRQCTMEWWNQLEDNFNSGFSKWQLGYKYYDKHWMTLTGREIETIYKCENNTCLKS